MKYLLVLLLLTLASCDQVAPPQFETISKAHVIGCGVYETTFLTQNGQLRLVQWTSEAPHPHCTAWNQATYWDVTIRVEGNYAAFTKAQIVK